MAASSHSGIKIHIPACPVTTAKSTDKPKQLTLVESEVMDSVCHLKDWNHIFGKFPTLDEVVEPVLDGSIRAIANAVHQEIAAANGEVIDVDEGDKGDDSDSRDIAVT
ncbi:hypothetical protein ID866_12209 [Astraeus odoratus]|nr:hypothetical protein ID866_12209 [Astraeus odoratus]